MWHTLRASSARRRPRRQQPGVLLRCEGRLNVPPRRCLLVKYNVGQVFSPQHSGGQQLCFEVPMSGIRWLRVLYAPHLISDRSMPQILITA